MKKPQRQDIMSPNECPFCGGDEIEIEQRGDEWQVICCDCEGAGPVCDSKSCAIWEWNKVSDAINL